MKKLLLILLSLVMVFSSVAMPVSAQAATNTAASASTAKSTASSGKNDGWKKQNQKWYYYKNNKAATGWLKVSGKWYYFNSSGVMQTGWQKISGKWYYLNASGAMQTGWQKISGKWYYLNASGVMQTGWQKISGKWYYLNASGAMQTGWQKISGKWYYLNTSGVMLTGWQTINKNKYYFDKNGVMCTTSVTIGDYKYTFAKDGKLTNTTKISDETVTPPTVTQPTTTTCNHNWVVLNNTPATFNEEGYYCAYCSKCYAVDEKKTSKLTADLNTSHYASPKTTYGANGPHTSDRCSSTPVLKYGTTTLTLEYQKERATGSAHSYCVVCKCDLHNRFFHDRWEYLNGKNTEGAKRFKAFASCIEGQWDIVFADYEISKSAYFYDSYIHICNNFNNGNLIYNNVDNWYYSKYGRTFWSDYGSWSGYQEWRYDSNGNPMHQFYQTIDSSREDSYNPVKNAGFYNADPNIQYYTGKKVYCTYTGYYWQCPNCGERFPAYEKDGTMAGVPVTYYNNTITFEQPYEWTTGVLIKSEKASICSKAEMNAFDKQYNVVRSRLKGSTDAYYYQK